MLAQLTDISFGYSGEDLFERLTWQINPGERVGLVGPNGAGKSTLLRLLTGTLTPQGGTVARARGATIGYLLQSQEFHGAGTIRSQLLEPFSELLAMQREMEELSGSLGDERALARYGELEEVFRHRGGYALEARLKELAQDVGFGPNELDRQVTTLSGGERNRLELAKVLLAEPDLLLLDEPTNHLDVESCERLERFLASYPKAFVLVSHDRYFLDAVVTKIAEVDDGEIRDYAGGWSRYVVEREKQRALELAAVERQREEIARTEDFIRRNIAGQNTKQAQGRRKMLAKVERLEWHRDVWASAGRISLRFEIGERAGPKEVLTAESLAVGYPDSAPLVNDTSFTIYRGDRVGIVGPNGAGKSTLMKTLLGKVPPAGGTCRRGTDLRMAYFDQKLGDLDESRSLVDEIRATRGDLGPDAVRSYLARFRFFGDDVFRTVKGLSGGERNRLSLAKMMLRPANVLALDEPTNHLDIPAREVLEKALVAYEGTLLVVSHDRFFLDQICTRLIVIADGRAEIETGNWSDHRRRASRTVSVPVAEPDTTATPAASGTSQKQDYEREKARKAEKTRQERRMATLEAEIADLESRIAAQRARLAQEHGGEWQKLNALVDEERRLGQALAGKLAEWEELGERLSSS